ncbi:NAD(P)/FAD-dependent oxidoreductase [Marinithermus hydrothermalis]|uniref:Ferredoxin--NADP reductase n=1 Tax=Marinithermus hydrothermalis (strain DSM 14884 / JCM 11576 / T1) TaxID=869210 RepID=F2NR17_MARHT|nr:NAD(P)/FAD-dependent oxidoreductase [Marinithermus hydrothermalis]AEB12595.1 Ferredoxin--NADP reductase [Marinithermus hydrothermalis DSM 14884]
MSQPEPIPPKTTEAAEPYSDVLIVGAGPSGLFAGFYVGLRGLSVRLIDPLPEPGGQLSALYPEKYIYDVAGFPKVRAKDLVDRLVEQLAPFQPAYALGERAETLEEADGLFRVTTSQGRAYRARAVIVTAGVGAFQPRGLEAPGIREFEGRGVAYAVRRVQEYAGRRVLIVGGGDSAVDWALGLKDVAQVTLIHRRAQFRAHAATVQQLLRAAEAQELEVLTPYEVREVTGDTQVRRAVIFHNQTGEERTLEVDAVLVLTGYVTRLGPLANWGLELERNKIKVNSRMETSRPGVFAAGDIVTYPGKLPLIALGFGEAAIAANHAAVYAHPELKVNPGHSSEKPPQGAPSGS